VGVGGGPIGQQGTRPVGVIGGRHCATAWGPRVKGGPIGWAVVGPLSWAGPKRTVLFCN
jgi:hypothetical protein